jgi:hypothetical protein
MSDYDTPPPPPSLPPPPDSSGYYASGAAGAPPPNYLVWAILTTVLCCLPLGVVSIVFAAQVNSKWYAGDIAGARDSSTKAKNFAMWSAVAGGVGVILWVILVVGLGMFGQSSMSNGY